MQHLRRSCFHRDHVQFCFLRTGASLPARTFHAVMFVGKNEPTALAADLVEDRVSPWLLPAAHSRVFIPACVQGTFQELVDRRPLAVVASVFAKSLPSGRYFRCP